MWYLLLYLDLDLSKLPVRSVDETRLFVGITQPTEPDAPWCPQPSMAMVNELIYKVECLHVLCLLMVGKHRRKAQQVFADMKLIPGLCSIFENFIWNLRGLVGCFHYLKFEFFKIHCFSCIFVHHDNLI